MRLLLDEHYSFEIAERLRERGHDVSSVKERPDLAGVSDAELWSRMRAERRAIVTENVGDFMPLFHEAAATGEDHWGLLFTSPRSMPRSRATIGLFLASLDAFLRERPGEDALPNQAHWLEPRRR